MKERSHRRLRAAVAKITFVLLVVAGQIAGGSAPAAANHFYVKISAPTNGATVIGTVTIATTESDSVTSIDVFVDGVWVASNPSTQPRPYSVVWNSALVANGSHTVSVTGYNANNGTTTARIGINVKNQILATATPPPTPSPLPTPAPTATANWVTITAPVNGATVSATVTIATDESLSVSWINVYVDNVWIAANPPTQPRPYSVVWNSTTVANGLHNISINGYSTSNAVIATTSASVSVQNGLPTPTPSSPPMATLTPPPTQKPTPPPPTPTPSAASTLTPTPAATATCCPIADAAAAAMVILNPAFEPRTDNYPANTTVPTSAALAQVGTISFLDSHGNNLIGKVTGNYTGTTDEILQWASYKWGFDPDVTRAIAVTETHWHQYDIGDIGNGVSLGILQIKSADFPGTCSPVSLNGGNTSFVTDPLCLSHLMTAFAADYKLAYQRACMDGSIGYLNQDTPKAGYPTYANATGNTRLWGCVGDWYSGNWYDSGAISYIQTVQGYLSSKPWLQAGF